MERYKNENRRILNFNRKDGWKEINKTKLQNLWNHTWLVSISDLLFMEIAMCHFMDGKDHKKQMTWTFHVALTTMYKMLWESYDTKQNIVMQNQQKHPEDSEGYSKLTLCLSCVSVRMCGCAAELFS